MKHSPIMNRQQRLRWFALGAIMVLGCGNPVHSVALFRQAAESGSAELKAVLERYVSSREAEIGACIIIDSRDTIRLNNDTAYPLNSVMKLFQSVALADEMNRRQIPLDTQLHIHAAELRPDTYSPLRDSLGSVADFSMAISELLRYSLQYSDNNACDILFRHLLDVASVEAHIRRLGIQGFALSVNEEEMHMRPERSSENWTRPDAAAALIDRIYTAKEEYHPYRRFVCRILDNCSTGQNRLAKPLSGTFAVIGHKTGTGFDDAEGHPQGINDVGFVRLPDGRHYTIAVFVKSSRYDMVETEQIIADMSAIVLNFLLHPSAGQDGQGAA